MQGKKSRGCFTEKSGDSARGTTIGERLWISESLTKSHKAAANPTYLTHALYLYIIERQPPRKAPVWGDRSNPLNYFWSNSFTAPFALNTEETQHWSSNFVTWPFISRRMLVERLNYKMIQKIGKRAAPRACRSHKIMRHDASLLPNSPKKE